MEKANHVIVGGGMTADAAVKGIREVDKESKILVIGAETDPPYKRPPLSKDLWTKDTPEEEIDLGTEEKGAHVICSRRIVLIDRGRKVVRDDQGEEYGYDQLLLATGGTPKKLSAESDGVIYYRTRADYRRLRESTREGEHVSVMGGGFIGTEIAAALTLNKRKVTMVFPERGIGARVFPDELVDVLTDYYEEKGVTVLSGQKPSVISHGNSLTYRLEGGKKIDSDCVVAGIGITPNTSLAEQAGLEVGDGIVVDKFLRTGDSCIYAAGDAANFHNPLLDQRMRVEHEDNALTMGRVAGRNMAGKEEAYEHLPMFYTDMFAVGYEAIGNTSAELDIVTEVGGLKDKGPICYLDRGRVKGIIFWNMFGKTDAGRDLMSKPGTRDETALKEWAGEIAKDD